MTQIILSGIRGLCEHVAVEEARKVRRMGRGSRERPRKDREMCLKSERVEEKMARIRCVQEAEGANCQIRARRMKRKRNGGKGMEEAWRRVEWRKVEK